MGDRKVRRVKGVRDDNWIRGDGGNRGRWRQRRNWVQGREGVHPECRQGSLILGQVFIGTNFNFWSLLVP